jgi:two-component sensor histidine kinase
MSSLSELLRDGGAPPERLLLRELAHRIDIELAVAIDLVSAAASLCDSSEAKFALVAVWDRLQRYAQLHHSLQMPEYTTTIDLAAYLNQLCRAISRSELVDREIELLLSAPPLRMSSERCWHLGMIVFELITSAAQHAFPDGTGSIHLRVRPNAASIECCITDTGVPDEDLSRRNGLAIVEALVRGLHGTVDMQSGPNETTTVVHLPYR